MSIPVQFSKKDHSKKDYSKNHLSKTPSVCEWIRVSLVLCFLSGPFFINVARAQNSDWPNWRGPAQNRISTATQLPAKWSPKGGEGSNLLWENKELAGRSNPVVLGNRLYTIIRHQPDTDHEGEAVVCVDITTGKIVWRHVFNVYLSDVPDTRLGWSSCVVDPKTKKVYVLGVCGYFCCLEGASGKVLWKRSLHEEFGLLSTYGGRTNIPIIFKDTVIISSVVIGWGDNPSWSLMAKPAHRFMAFDKATGEIRWIKRTRLIPYDTTYSTPTLTMFKGQPAMVFGSSDGAIWALQPGTGEQIWKYQLSERGVNISPLVGPNGHVYASHSEENRVGTTMGAIVAIDGNLSGDLSEKPLWSNYQVMAGKSSPLLVQGRLYVVDDRAKMFIYDAKTGQQIGKKSLGTSMRSTPIYADGKIYLCTNGGRYYTLKPTAKGVKVLHKLRLSGASNGSPLIAAGRIFIPTSKTMYCIGNTESIAASASQAKYIGPSVLAGSGLTSTERPQDEKSLPPVQLQIVPYDILLKPGATQKYHVRLYDRNGIFLRTANPSEIKFSVTGPGQIDTAGKYHAPRDVAHKCSLLTAKFAEIQSTARIRIVPPLPWKFDFNHASDVPLTWVGGRFRYVVREVEGQKIMVKRNEIPTRPGKPTTKLGTRSRLWMGEIGLNNYTIQADIQLQSKDGKLGDLGLINSRYTFALQGASQEIFLYSWCTHEKRTQAAHAYKLDPKVWYRTKLRVEIAGTEAKVYGKIWPRDKPEPAEWSLTMTDAAPNTHGSPGLFGNAKDAEIYLDNILVTPNKDLPNQ